MLSPLTLLVKGILTVHQVQEKIGTQLLEQPVATGKRIAHKKGLTMLKRLLDFAKYDREMFWMVLFLGMLVGTVLAGVSVYV